MTEMIPVERAMKTTGASDFGSFVALDRAEEAASDVANTGVPQ
jgi:hypothetical protein